MPKYNVNQPVPWERLCAILRWHLRMTSREYLRARTLFEKEPPLVESYKRKLRESCEVSQTVRRFLGHTHVTQAEKDALRLLEMDKGE